MGKCEAPHFPTWGYDRIQGALANLGHRISHSTVANTLREHGIEPAPERKRQATWHAFLKAHWDVLTAAERNHQGLNNRIIEPADELRCTTGKIACRQRLGGMLRYYYRRAA